jgi:hypothetical protein
MGLPCQRRADWSGFKTAANWVFRGYSVTCRRSFYRTHAWKYGCIGGSDCGRRIRLKRSVRRKRHERYCYWSCWQQPDWYRSVGLQCNWHWRIGTKRKHQQPWASCTGGFYGGNLLVDGNVCVKGDVILINTFGGDCAEDFDVNDTEASEPGTVLVIAVDGQLTTSSQAYDTRIAGVVSGAGELRPALILQRLKASHNQVPVALFGKVYCKVDASTAPVFAGDLLTTSVTRGHAMKVQDRARAVGAILGKALGNLEAGFGLIPILVGTH